jgi:glycosyltransferase involved in cell wall biosynthesis
MARPLIATDVPGCRAVVDRDRSGFFCDARSTESLAAAMERFMALPPGAQQAMGAAGRAKMEREYDQALVVDAYRAALEVVTGGRRGTH